MIDFKKEEDKYSQILAIRNIIKDPRVYDLICQAHADVMMHFSVSYDWEVELYLTSIKGIPAVQIQGTCIPYHTDYEDIAHIATDILSNNQISAMFEKIYTIDNIQFTIYDYITADIPEEELALLESLGKVSINEIEAQPSRTEKTIFCPN